MKVKTEKDFINVYKPIRKQYTTPREQKTLDERTLFFTAFHRVFNDTDIKAWSDAVELIQFLVNEPDAESVV